MASHTSLMPASPLLTPATAFWTLPFGAYLLFLSTRVSVGKNELGAKHKTELGKTEMASGEDPQNPDPLSPAGRCLGNYLGDASVAMILALLAELNGGNRGLVNYALGALFLGKVAEIEFGLVREGTQGGGPAVGFFTSQGVLAGMAGYCAYFVSDYWGIVRV